VKWTALDWGLVTAGLVKLYHHLQYVVKPNALDWGAVTAGLVKMYHHLQYEMTVVSFLYTSITVKHRITTVIQFMDIWIFTANADMMLGMPNYGKSTGTTVSQYTVNFHMFHTIPLFSNSACMCYSFPLLQVTWESLFIFKLCWCSPASSC